MDANDDDTPDMKCPQCKTVTPDQDGFGCVYCTACGRCDCVSQSGKDGRWVCNACGKDHGALSSMVQG